MQTKRPLIPEPVGLELTDLPRPIDFPKLFGNANPVELEIGCGKGTFITRQAVLRKDTNFFGLEWARFFYRYSADRLRRNDCRNAFMSRAEAAYFLDEFVPDASLSVIHVYYPDPWPKARHHKRRLIQTSFLEKAKRVLIPGGRLQIVTDHDDYWTHIEPTVKAGPMPEVEFVIPEGVGEGQVVDTNYERKFTGQHHRPHAIAVARP